MSETPPLKTSLWDSDSVHARSDLVWYTAGLTSVEGNGKWREAGLSPKWGTVARTRERSVINKAKTNYTPYGAPSRLLHSKTTCNMPTIDPQLHTGSHTITHPHTWLPVCFFFFFWSPQTINLDGMICKLKWSCCVQIQRCFENRIHLQFNSGKWMKWITLHIVPFLQTLMANTLCFHFHHPFFWNRLRSALSTFSFLYSHIFYHSVTFYLFTTLLSRSFTFYLPSSVLMCYPTLTNVTLS